MANLNNINFGLCESTFNRYKQKALNEFASTDSLRILKVYSRFTSNSISNIRIFNQSERDTVFIIKNYLTLNTSDFKSTDYTIYALTGIETMKYNQNKVNINRDRNMVVIIGPQYLDEMDSFIFKLIDLLCSSNYENNEEDIELEETSLFTKGGTSNL